MLRWPKQWFLVNCCNGQRMASLLHLRGARWPYNVLTLRHRTVTFLVASGGFVGAIASGVHGVRRRLGSAAPWPQQLEPEAEPPDGLFGRPPRAVEDQRHAERRGGDGQD